MALDNLFFHIATYFFLIMFIQGHLKIIIYFVT